jgi:membrane-bound lytic murein transglycosylase D
VSRLAQTYKVRHGESLVSVADRFGVTTAQLRAWNGLKSNVVPVGKVLRVSSPALGRAAGKSRRGKLTEKTGKKPGNGR